MKTHLLLFLLLFICQTLSAQSSPAVSIMQTINNRILAANQGYYDVTYRWKSASKTDTTGRSARVYFFRKEEVSDSICRFAIFVNGALDVVYDGTNFCYVNAGNKTVSFQTASEKGGPIKMLRNTVRSISAFEPYLFKDRVLRLDKFKNALVDTIAVDGKKNIRVTVLDSFVNEMKFAATDLAMGQEKTIYTVSWPDLILCKRQQIVTFMVSPQYLEQSLSPVTILPDSVTFDKIFDLPALQAAGYMLVDNNKNTNAAREPVLKIAVGDTMPAFQLSNLDGVQTSSDDLQGLVLLDFWYKGCFPCLKALPVLERLHQKYKDRHLQVLGVNGFDQDPVDLKKFLQSREVSYPTVLDADKKLAQQLQLTAYPTIILFDSRTRKVLLAQRGFLPDMETKVAEIVEGYPGK